MRATDLIIKKRDGDTLSAEEINWFINAYVTGDIPDYQAAAWLMAVYFQGMTRQETVDLTLAMVQSGEQLDLSDVVDYAVDKHSSGGVGDKTTLVVLPLVAAAGVTVAKMSGRGLGYSGGTLDKMEAIAGFHSDLSLAAFKSQARKIGLVLAGQTANLAPADGLLYALRDVTGTVPSMPLIASSIMSKKIAAGARGIVLDVKVGLGAFMHTVDAARDLAKMMVQIGRDAGRDVVALISDMNQPLGHAVGNALEVHEAIETLQGGGPIDLREHALAVAAHMVCLYRQDERPEALGEAIRELDTLLQNGRAWDKFRALVDAQGGDLSIVDDPGHLPKAGFVERLYVPHDAFVAQVSALDVGIAAYELGAGRARKGDPVDFAVGVVSHLKVGQQVRAGDLAFTIHANDQERLAIARRHCERAVVYREHVQAELPLFYDTITSAE